MAESGPPQRAPSVTRPPAEKRARGRRLASALVAFVLVALAAWFAVSVLPRWWSHEIGDQVQGDLTTGALLGFMYGFLAAVLPLAVLAVVFRFFRRSVKAWLIGGAVALLLAAPNLVTLGIALGRGDAAHAADRTLDVEAPYFRGGMLIGVVLALVLAGAWLSQTRSRRRERRRADEAERRLAEAHGKRDETAGPTQPPPS